MLEGGAGGGQEGARQGLAGGDDEIFNSYVKSLRSLDGISLTLSKSKYSDRMCERSLYFVSHLLN